MPRLKALRPKVGAMAPKQRATPIAAAQPTYGQGRGGRPWRRLVQMVKLRDQYVCQLCQLVTEQGECDHRVPQAEGGTDDPSNLQWLCIPCHEEKTREEAARGVRRGAFGTGRP